MQFSLELPNGIKASEIYSDLPHFSFDNYHIKVQDGKNMLFLSWNTNEGINIKGLELLKIKHPDNQPAIFTFNKEYRNEVYDNELAVKQLDLEKKGGDGFKLLQNAPNPFTKSTSIRFEVFEKQEITVRLHDINGVELQNKSEYYEPGFHESVITIENGNPGIYYLTLESDLMTSTVKMVVVR